MKIGDKVRVIKPLDGSHKLNHIGVIDRVDHEIPEDCGLRYAVDGMWCIQCELVEPSDSSKAQIRSYNSALLKLLNKLKIL